MSRFEFIANKFYEITAWSLLASVVMTLISKSDMIPSSLLWQIPLLSFLGAVSCLIYPWDHKNLSFGL